MRLREYTMPLAGPRARVHRQRDRNASPVQALQRGFYALRDLSLTVNKGEFVFLTGPSGAGKSTFLRLLLLQERPSEGEILVNGYDLARLTRREVQEYRRGIGFIFQDFKLIPGARSRERLVRARRCSASPDPAPPPRSRC
jgi:cell division transport system ATP-binding protein